MDMQNAITTNRLPITTPRLPALRQGDADRSRHAHRGPARSHLCLCRSAMRASAKLRSVLAGLASEPRQPPMRTRVLAETL
jgi:hypothetical protein